MNCTACGSVILAGEPTETCSHGLKCETCFGQNAECPECAKAEEARRTKEREEEEYRSWTSYYGSQYYGGWNRDPKDGRYKPQAVIDGLRRAS